MSEKELTAEERAERFGYTDMGQVKVKPPETPDPDADEEWGEFDTVAYMAEHPEE